MLNDQVTKYDDIQWMIWSKANGDDGDGQSSKQIYRAKIALQRIRGSVEDLIDQFDDQ